MIIPFIHQRADWPEFRWDDSALTGLLAEVRHRQGLLLGRMRGLGFESKSEATLTAMTNEIVASSAIEGESLDVLAVRSSIAQRLGLDGPGLPAASRGVDGVVELMVDATRNFTAPLTADRVFGWHSALFPSGRSGMRKITVGAWRTPEVGPMQVISGPIGRERVHYAAPAAELLEEEMSRFLQWFNSTPTVDPVLNTAIAHFWFVTIHPFEDGNGRIARAIADMGLARADGSSERFYSMSKQILAERKGYYLQLESAQRGSLDITAWLRWFLDCLYRALLAAEKELAAVLNKAELWRLINVAPVNERQRLVINRLLGDFKAHLTTSNYAKLAKTSTDTALR
ncbi:MAG TPA: Fic family protein, partial [Trueperaceae bacterium]|nr:Fic family protein [Trueperaceae bacterium]